MAYTYLIDPNNKTLQPSKKVIFVVEGVDDGIFLEKILSDRGESPDKMEIRSVQGNGALRSYVAALTKSPFYTSGGVEKIGVVVDADKDFAATESTIRSWLTKLDLPSPASGKVDKKGPITVGLYLFPNSKSAGELEDLICEALKGDPRVVAARGELQRFRPGLKDFDKLSKRVIQICLAVTDGELCSGVGRGIRNGMISVDKGMLSDLNGFVKSFLEV